MYRAFTVAGSVCFGYISFRYRRMKIGNLGDNYAARENELALNIMNDLMLVILGYVSGHLFSCDYMYKHR